MKKETLPIFIKNFIISIIIITVLILDFFGVVFLAERFNQGTAPPEAARIETNLTEKNVLRRKQGVLVNYPKPLSQPVAKAAEEQQLPAYSTNERYDIGDHCQLPSVPSHVKYFTDYRKYNLPYTPHYRLQQAAWTDNQGLRRYSEDYIVALGSHYSTSVGDRFKITLEGGETFTVIFGDGKWDADCDCEKMYTPCTDYNGECAANLLEFVIDKDVLDPGIYEYGSIDRIKGFEGSVVDMIYLGRDSSADWDRYD